MNDWSVRVGAWSGWISLVGVLVALVVLPTAIAGAPPIAATDMTAVRAHFAHAELAWLLGLANTFVIVAIIPFGLGMRTWLATTPAARYLATLGLAFLVVSAGLYLVQGALAAALVQASRDGGEIAGLYRFYDVLYNSAADVLEGSWVLGFGLAMAVQDGPMLRWVGALGVLVGITRWGKALIPFAGPAPDAIPMVLGLLFFVWFAAAVVGLTRASATSVAHEPAPAGVG